MSEIIILAFLSLIILVIGVIGMILLVIGVESENKNDGLGSLSCCMVPGLILMGIFFVMIYIWFGLTGGFERIHERIWYH